MSSVAIEDRGISISDLSRVIKDDDLGEEIFGFSGWVILFIRADISSLDILDGNVLNVKTDVISGNGFQHRFMVHFDGLDFSGDVGWGENNLHSRLQDTCFNSSDWDSTDTSNFVDVL